jgi:hypothetical protein
MIAPETTILINQLTADTRASKIDWVKTTPTTFTWQKKMEDNTQAYVSLQKVQQSTPQVVAGKVQMTTTEDYILQLHQRPTNTLLLDIKTQENPEIRPTLKTLFDVISQDIERRGVALLKKIMGN